MSQQFKRVSPVAMIIIIIVAVRQVLYFIEQIYVTESRHNSVKPVHWFIPLSALMFFISRLVGYYWVSSSTSSRRLMSSSAVSEVFGSWVGGEIRSTWFWRAISCARTSEQQHFISRVKRIPAGAIICWMLLLPAARWPVALLRSNGGLIGDRSLWTRGSPWLFRLTCVSLPAKWAQCHQSCLDW